MKQDSTISLIFSTIEKIVFTSEQRILGYLRQQHDTHSTARQGSTRLDICQQSSSQFGQDYQYHFMELPYKYIYLYLIAFACDSGVGLNLTLVYFIIYLSSNNTVPLEQF